MWPFQSKEKKQAIAEARRVLTDARTRLARADPAEAVALATGISANESVAVLAPAERAALTDQAFTAYGDNVLADDVLTPEEEKTFAAVGEALGYTTAAIQSRHPDLLSRLVVAKANSGRLDEIQDHLVMTKRGEIVHLEVEAQLLREVAVREFRGGSQGVSIPIAKGVRYRVGGMRGRMVTVGSTMTVQDTGTLSVTSQRVAYLGANKSSEIPFTKLMGLEVFTDGIRLQASNRQNTFLFRFTGGVRGDAVAATIHAAVQRSLA